MLQRLRKQYGCTLAELLIVAAIVAVLAAVAIPFFSIKLEKSREAADLYLMRSVASIAQDYYYEDVHDKASATAAGMGWYGVGSSKEWNAFAVYDPVSGSFYPSWESFIDAGGKGYGKGTKTNGGTDVKDFSGELMYDPKADYTKAGCQVCIFPHGVKRIEVAWKIVQRGSRPFVGKTANGYHPVYTLYLD